MMKQLVPNRRLGTVFPAIHCRVTGSPAHRGIIVYKGVVRGYPVVLQSPGVINRCKPEDWCRLGRSVELVGFVN